VPINPPPHDENGVVPHDHDEIVQDDLIIRRISRHHIVMETDGSKRISSMAFKPSSGMNAGMSIDIEKLIIEDGLDPKKFVKKDPWIAAVSFTAGELRNNQFQVGYDPLDDNPYHGEVWGDFKKNRPYVLKGLAKWYIR
jgi:hypothetical protein